MGPSSDATPLVSDLQQAIRESGLSLQRLGKEAGVSQGQLSRFVRGERTLTLPAAAKLCVFFGLRLAKANSPVAETGRTFSKLPGEEGGAPRSAPGTK